MRFPLLLATAGALCTAAVAQNPVNDFHVYTDRTSFTSRAFLGGDPGETLQGYPEMQYRGIGDTGDLQSRKACLVYGFGLITQDQNATTVETYWVVFRRATLTGEPDGSPDGLITEFGPFNMPTGPDPVPAAWNITINFASSPVSVPCKDSNFYAGIRLSENQAWTADGQSSWASAYTDPASTAGDPVIAGAPSWAYQVDATGATRPTNPRSWNYRLRTERAVFQIGCVQTTDGLFGSCGNYPDITVQGLAFRVRDELNANAPFAVFVADSLTGGPPIAFDGHLWLNPGGMLMVAQGTLDAAGTIEFVPPGFGPGEMSQYSGFGNLPFQAAILNVGTGRFPIRTSNAQASHL